MVATFWLLGCVLAPAQTPIRPMPVASAPALRSNEWVLTPRLGRGQELVYRGTYTEEASGRGTQFQRGYRFETRYFVLETPPRGTDLAVLTSLHCREAPPANQGGRAESGVTSIRLERVQVDLQGKVSSNSGMSLAVPLDGAPTLEVGAFLEVPPGRGIVTQGWDVPDPGRPTIAWRLLGNDSFAGQTCLKLLGVQQSDDWERPRADRSAWRRQETVWLAPRTGLTLRVERIIEQREPARREVGQRAVLRYELESSLQYPPQLALDRRQEVLQAFSFRETAAPLLAEPIKFAKPLQQLQRRIGYHIESHPPTPFRDAVLLLRRQVDAAVRGEVVPVAHQAALTRPVPVAGVGDPAPEFVAGPITTKESARLSRWKGRPILLVFYNPASYTAADLLRFAQGIQAVHGKQVSVVGLSVSDDPRQVIQQRDQLRLDFPIYSGGGMRISYGVETTPKMVVIDPTGVVRGAYLGWGRETASEVLTELRRWLTVAPPPGGAKPAPR